MYLFLNKRFNIHYERVPLLTQGDIPVDHGKGPEQAGDRPPGGARLPVRPAPGHPDGHRELPRSLQTSVQVRAFYVL